MGGLDAQIRRLLDIFLRLVSCGTDSTTQFSQVDWQAIEEELFRDQVSESVSVTSGKSSRKTKIWICQHTRFVCCVFLRDICSFD